MKVIRNLDKLGRVCIPKEILDELEVEGKDAFEIYTCGDKIILKRKYYRSCSKCMNDEIRRKDKFCNRCGARLRV